MNTFKVVVVWKDKKVTTKVFQQTKVIGVPGPVLAANSFIRGLDMAEIESVVIRRVPDAVR